MWLTLILSLILAELVFDFILERLNLKNFSSEPPPGFESLSGERYQRAREYHRDKSRLGTARHVTGTVLLLGFILAGGFAQVDEWARAFSSDPVWAGLAFAGILSALKLITSLPFGVYDTFVVEERHGFNRATPGVFAGDLCKGVILGAILGGAVFAGLIAFFETLGPSGWIWAWFALMAFQIFVLFLAPAVILPLFNKFEPLPEGELRQAIQAYAAREKFSLQGVYIMDSSKRTAKTNAFFTGIGKLRRLVLFDTLVSRHSVEQIVAVVAHEVGHFKRGHIPKMIAMSAITSGVMLFVLSRLIGNPGLFEAFGMSQVSVYASLIFVGILYSPVSRLLSMIPNAVSRKFEYEADAFSTQTYGKPEALVEALKKLCEDNFAHLTPHPAKVFADYSHPPALQRIARIRARSGPAQSG